MKFSDIVLQDEYEGIKKDQVIVDGKRLAKVIGLFKHDNGGMYAMCIYILRKTFKPSGSSGIFSLKTSEIIKS